MNARIEFISAGAGSGKTYKLTETVAQALELGHARPQGVLATTFTVKAAAELRERVRSRLLGQRRVDLAMAIGQARIGTINSVCGQLLKRFCFELGLSPQQDVLGDTQARRLLHITVDASLSDERRDLLVTLSERLGLDSDQWISTIRQLVQTALSNDIHEPALRGMGQTNADQMLSHWPAVRRDVDEATLTAALHDAANLASQVIDELSAADKNVPKNLREGRDELQRLARQFQRGQWTWIDWYKASRLDAGAKVKDAVALVNELAAGFEAHPSHQGELRQLLVLLFDCAADALRAYGEAKRQQGVVDFVDQEVLLLQAVRSSSAVRQALAEELDLIVVDEFQDTSPLQLALFIELAQLAKRSVWVGDPKQAIYGFRGTDATLITGVLQALPQWGGVVAQALTTSRRSTPELVSAVNAVFGRAFEPDLSPAQVELQPHRGSLPEQPSLIQWQFDSKNNKGDYKALGQAVRELLAQGLQIQDRHSGQIRPVRPGDIGILCATNDDVKATVESLNTWHVPAASPRPGLLQTAEATLVVAALRRLHDSADTIATALILSLARGEGVDEWVSDRLSYLTTEGADPSAWRARGDQADALLARLESLRPRLHHLTPAEALRLAATECDVAGLAQRWSGSPLEGRTRQAHVQALLDMARTYEDECRMARRAATVAGLLRWLQEQAEAGTDARSVTADDAVSVLTYHGAKGLEWPVVVLTGLDNATRGAVWSVRARTLGDFNPQTPLLNRFVHCWLKPLDPRSSTPASQSAENSPTARLMFEQALAEHKRLLYVGLTRARDLNVLVTCLRKGVPQQDWIDEIPGAADILLRAEETSNLPDGRPILRAQRAWTAADIELEPAPAPLEACHWFGPRPRQAHLPLWMRPSTVQGGVYRVQEVAMVGQRLTLSHGAPMDRLGQALHLCLAKATAQGALTQADIAHALNTWAVSQAVDTAEVLQQLQAFEAWCQQQWPGAERLAEVPIEAPGPQGTRIHGRIDYLLRTPQGWVLIDHKANPRGSAGDDALARTYGPQLSTYAQAILAATGVPVLQAWLYQPVAGRAVRLAGDHLP